MPRAPRERLTAVDAAYIRLETPRTPMHTAPLLIFSLPPGEDESWVVRLVAEMQALRPRSGLYVRRLPGAGDSGTTGNATMMST